MNNSNIYSLRPKFVTSFFYGLEVLFLNCLRQNWGSYELISLLWFNYEGILIDNDKTFKLVLFAHIKLKKYAI